LAKTIAFAKEFSGRNYTALFSLHRSFRTSLFVLFSGISETYGFSNASFSAVYKHTVKYIPRYHEVRRNLLMLNERKAADWRIKPELKLDTGVFEKVIAEKYEHKGIVAIAPGSVWETKRYPAERFAETARELVKDGFLVLILGSAEEEKLAAAFPADEHIINLCGKMTIIETASLLARCTLLITNDSALTHFGMAAGCNVLTIYCSTVAAFGFYPYLHGSETIGLDNLPCKPCGIHGRRACPLGHFNCARMLPAAQVSTKARTMLTGENH
jgi:heptosyltransferase-2